MTTFSEFAARHDLGGTWSVRFTAAEARARGMAEGYRRSGYEVRLLPIASAEGTVEADAVGPLTGEYEPVRDDDGETCTTCLGDDTYVLVTRPTDAAVDDELPY